LDALNSYIKFKFTHEVEEEARLNYLDTIIHRHNNKLKLKWYKKPTASGRIINYFSKHPRTMIINTALSCINKIFTLSDRTFHEDIKKEITEILTNNYFSHRVIRSLIKQQLHNTNIAQAV